MKRNPHKFLAFGILFFVILFSQGFLFTQLGTTLDRPAPPLPPGPPYLYKPTDYNFDAAYLVDWTDVDCVGSYKLQEADNPDFTNAANYGLTASNSQKWFINDMPGTYYYRVKASSAHLNMTKEPNFLNRFLVWLRKLLSRSLVHASSPSSGVDLSSDQDAHTSSPCYWVNLNTDWSNIQSITIVEPESFIDGTVFDADTELPLQDAEVSSPDFPGSEYTDINGEFSFSFQTFFPEEGRLTVTIDITKDDFTQAQRTVEVVAARHSAVNPVYLTILDPVVTIIPPEGGTHINSTGEIELIFPAGAVSEPTDVNTTKYQQAKALPDELPEASFFTYALNLEAVSTSPNAEGIRQKITNFQQPVTMRVANTLGFAAGTPIPAGVFNDQTHQWEDTGLMGYVSSDGAWLEFEITSFSPWDLNLPAPPPPEDRPGNPTENKTPDITKTPVEAEDPGVGVKSGGLTTEHSLPSVRRLGKEEALKLVYRSLTAQPSSLISIETDLDPVTTNVPATTTFKVNIADRVVQATYQGVEGEVRYAYMFDAKDPLGQALPTGSYPYTIEISNNYTNVTYWTTNQFAGEPIANTGIPTIEPVPLTTTINDRLIINNQQNSPFGAGWNLAGLQRLYFDPEADTILLTEGDGSSMVIRARPVQPIPDIVAAITYADNVSVLIGNGDGSFSAPSDIPVGNNPYSVVAADFNGDTLDDLAVANYDSNNISILLNNGDGTFTAQPDISVGNNPRSLAQADFDADTIPDLAVVNFADNDVSILLGNGDGTFTAQPDVPVGLEPYSITTADFNGDDIPDLAVTNYVDYDVSILLGNGDGTFLAQSDVAVGSAPYAITAADFNGDSLFDLAVTNEGDLDVSILLSHGDGTFIAKPDISVGHMPWSIATADFNQDFIPDLVVGNWADSISVLIGNGDGTFLIKERIPAYEHPLSITTADFDGDTLIDLAVANEYSHDVSILLGNGDGTFTAQPEVALGYNPVSIAAANFNSDYFQPGYIVYNGDYSFIKQGPGGTYTRKLKDDTKINFNTEGLQTSLVDRNGNATRYYYTDANSDGKQEELRWIVLPKGGKYEFSYTAQGKLESITDPAGRITEFTIDANGDLVGISNPDATTKSFTYTDHLLTAETNERLYTTELEYDDYKRVTRMLFPNTPQEIIQFFPSDVQGLINDLAPGVGIPENPAPVVRPEDIVETIIDGENYTTTSQTSKLGSYTQITDALSQITLIERDADNNPIKITRPNTSVVTLTYDGRGNLLSSAEYDDSGQDIITRFTYEPEFNQIASIIQPQGNTTSIDYDVKGNPIQITDAMNNITKMEYNSRGLLTKIISGFGTAIENETTFTYYTDTYNLRTITDPLGNITTFTYDDAGNILTIKDAENSTTAFEYDDMNRLTKVIDADNKITQYQYDEAGNLKKIIDANLSETDFQYDQIDQLKQITNPLGKFKTFGYDLNRNLESIIDFKGETIVFTYDEINRLINKTGPGLNTSYGYDSVNNLASVTTLDSGLSFTYDLLARLKSATTIDDGHQPSTTITYEEYNPNSNLIYLVDPQSIRYEYVHDDLGRLTWMYDKTNNKIITSLDYDELSRRTTLNYPQNNTSTSYEYDLASRLTSMTITGPGQIKTLNTNKQILGLLDDLLINKAFAATKTTLNPARSTLNAYTYTYDNVGNRLTMTDNDGLHNYAYDDLYRLTGATHPTIPQESYLYDPLGNRNPASFVHDAANRLLEDDEYTYTYDDNGNLISKTDKLTSETTVYTYNVENQLISINYELTTINYVYDGLGRRIEKNVNGTITRYVYDNEDIMCEYDGTNTLIAKYIHGPGIDEPLRMERGGQLYWYHVDGLGSITNITDSTGSTVKTYLYDSFGNIVNETGTLTNPYTYTGREFDEESGLYYYRARYYDARIGRFLQEDPIGFLGGDINFYAYVNNNPINLVDPLGLLGKDVIKEELDKIFGDKLSEAEKDRIADFTGQQVKPWHVPGLMKQDPKALEQLEKRLRKKLPKADKETQETFEKLEKLREELAKEGACDPKK